MTPDDAYQWLTEHSRETAYLISMGQVLGWDQRTHIPPKGHPHRHNQFAMLAKWIHARATDPRVGEALARVEASDLVADPMAVAAVNVREWRRDYDRAVKIPQDLAVALAKATAEGETAWERTRPASDWETFKPFLVTVVALKREEAQALGYAAEPYDAHLDDFEPGETAAALAPLLGELRVSLLRVLAAVQGSGRRPQGEVVRRHFPVDGQDRLARLAAQAIGYDFAGGRLDPTAHPFSAGIGPGDVRITTRFDEHYFCQAFFGVLHETGHALYDQGLPADHWGTPRGDTVSLGIHESQSRLWENLVGRSLGFWQFFYPEAQETFPVLQDVPLEVFHFAVNEVKPSLIRTEADEVTYNLHILLRFELERALMNGDLEVEDLPGAFNDKMQRLPGADASRSRPGGHAGHPLVRRAVRLFPHLHPGEPLCRPVLRPGRGGTGSPGGGVRPGRFCPAAHLAEGEDSLPGPPPVGPAAGPGGDGGGVDAPVPGALPPAEIRGAVRFSGRWSLIPGCSQKSIFRSGEWFP